MANIDELDKADWPMDAKVLSMLLCIAQDKRAEIARLIKPTDLSMSQLQILHILDDGPAIGSTVNDIKSKMLDDSPNVSRALNKLVDAGYVMKHRSDTDQRVVTVMITEAGQKAHVKADTLIMAMPQNLNDEELSQLYTLLKRY